MSANIYTDSTGRASFARASGTKEAWHGLGQTFDVDATLEQIAVAAGMNYELLKVALQYEFNGQTMTVPNRVGLVRSDTGANLATVSKRYQVHQPSQILDWFRALCDSEQWIMDTAGVLGNGAKYWAMARTTNEASIAGSRHVMNMLLATSCDGSIASIAQPTDIRVVCSNTLGFATRGKEGEQVRIKHSTAFDPERLHRDLATADLPASWSAYVDSMTHLAETEISPQDARDVYTELLRPQGLGLSEMREIREAKEQPADPSVVAEYKSADTDGDILSSIIDVSQSRIAEHAAGASALASVLDSAAPQSDRAVRGLDAILESYQSAPGARPGTAYGVVQGTTHYLDHVRGGDATRTNSAWFGQGSRLKERTVEILNG